MTSRRHLLAANALPVFAAVVLTACAGPTSPTSPSTSAAAASTSAAVSAAPAAPGKDSAAACSAELTLSAAVPPGADPDAPTPSAQEMQAWAASVAGPFATLRANVPDSLRDSIAVFSGQLDQARQGKRVDFSDDKSTAASNAVDGWVHSNCGFQELDLTSTAGKLGPAPATLSAGPVSIAFTTTGAPAAYVVLLGRVKDGQTVTAAAVDAHPDEFDKAVDVVTAAQPAGAQPGYATAMLKSGHYLLTGVLGQPPNFSGGTNTVDLTVP